MLEIRPDKLDRYREIVARIDAPLEHKEQFINAVRNLLQARIDKAWGDDPVQLATKSGLSDSFQSIATHASLGSRQDAIRVDLDDEGAITKTESGKDKRHDEHTNEQSSHLLPRF